MSATDITAVVARRGDTQETAKQFGLSESFLEKDRLGARRIPFIKLGRKVLYDFTSVESALAAYEVGGPQSKRGRR